MATAKTAMNVVSAKPGVLAAPIKNVITTAAVFEFGLLLQLHFVHHQPLVVIVPPTPSSTKRVPINVRGALAAPSVLNVPITHGNVKAQDFISV
jgi:hypothetical protein